MRHQPYPDAEELTDHWWWRPGWQVGTRFYAWHVLLDDQPDLVAHVQRYQRALEGIGTLDLVPASWLHITMQGVGHVSDVPPDRLEAITGAVADRVGALSAPALFFNGAVLHREAITIPPTDLAPLRAVRKAVRQGMADVLGDDGLPDDDTCYRPHVSLAYVNGPTPAHPVRAALDGVHAGPVEVVIRQASLIEMHRDQRMYQWEPITVAHLSLT